MIEIILHFFGNYLIEFMTAMVVTSLALRWISFTHSKQDDAYYSHFTRELSSTIQEDKAKGVRHDFKEIEDYLNDILGRVNQKLPERNLRHNMKGRRPKEENKREGVSLREYVGSKHGMIVSIQSESNVFNSNVPPSFSQLTERVMNEDEHWSKLFGFMPIDGVTRILDVLPTLFIILGVFGTFIGISEALPEIARIDFNNLDSSGQTLAEFVISVTFAMRTSIAGIFFSIVLTLLNTIFPIDATREKTFEKVETALQILWYHLHTDNKDEAIKRELQEMGQTLKMILKKIGSGPREESTESYEKKKKAS